MFLQSRHPLTFEVKLSSLVIKAVCHFVPYHCTHRSKIYCIIRIFVKEGMLENSCWKDDFIQARMVVSIHRLWCHVPFCTICWRVHFFDSKSIFELTCLEDHIEEGFIVCENKRFVVDPFIGVSYLQLKHHNHSKNKEV